MITGEIKSQIDKIWNDFWTGGISNPLTVIEQFSYLIFLKQLDDKQTIIDKEKALLGKSNKKDFYTPEQHPLRWSYFKDLDPERMMDVFRIPQTDLGNLTAFDFMRTLGAEGGKFSQYMKGATFMIESPNLLDKVVQQIDKLPLSNRDTKGDLYEYMLSKIAEAGTNGQFRTPRHVIRMMVELMQPQQDDIICDPAMGTAGFLVNAAEYIQEMHEDWLLEKGFRDHYYGAMFNGMEIDTSMLRIASMNLQLHGIENPTLVSGSALAERNDISSRYSLILANPPFKGALDSNEVESSLLKMTSTKKTEILFLSLMLRMLSLGGRAAVIVPDGVLFGSSGAHKAIRKELVDNQQLQAVISMPSGVFKPYAGVSTAILIFTKTNSGGTDKVWYYDMKADGYSLDDKRSPIAANNIPDIITRYKNLSNEADRARTEPSFLVPADEIRNNGYDLSINRYKEVVYEEVVYEKPAVILEQIAQIDRERKALLNELKELL